MHDRPDIVHQDPLVGDKVRVCVCHFQVVDCFNADWFIAGDSQRIARRQHELVWLEINDRHPALHGDEDQMSVGGIKMPATIFNPKHLSDTKLRLLCYWLEAHLARVHVLRQDQITRFDILDRPKAAFGGD